MLPKTKPVLVLGILATLGCGAFPKAVVCDTPETIVSKVKDNVLTCEEVKKARAYVEVLSGRPLSRKQRGQFYRGLRDNHQSQSERVRNQITQIEKWMTKLVEPKNTAVAEIRSHEVWRTATDKGVIQQRDGAVWDVQKAALAVRARVNDQELALTEMDIEGWIRLGSLCREVQGGSPLQMSVADREQIYLKMAREFKGLSREKQLARLSIGPFWSQFENRWKGASYEKQQSWIMVSPLPPPMNVRSREYMDAVLDLPPTRMTYSLHTVFGPFSMP